MNGKKIEIQLHTPILLRTGDAEPGAKDEPVFRIIGKVESFSDSGVLLNVLELCGIRDAKVTYPHAILYIPSHKIDHFFVVG